MNALQIFLLALSVALSQSISFKVAGKFLVSVVSAPGTVPHHLSYNEARDAIKQVLSGKTGTIAVGDVSLTVAPI